VGDEICGFTETFRDAMPPNTQESIAGEAYLHIADARKGMGAARGGDRTMVRIAVHGIEPYAEYQKRGGKVHPNGSCKPRRGTKEFGRDWT